MGKVLYCSKADPSSDCKEVIRGKTVEEVLRKAQTHVKEHGMVSLTPQLIEKAKAMIEDE
jgi:predicted small metal-binding protein